MESRFPFRFGVYEIINKINGHRYIGSAGGRSINQRLNDHLRTLRSNTHHNIYLQRAYNFYGESNFKLRPVLFCDKEHVLWYEQLLLDGLQPKYNLCPTAGNSAGYKHSAENKIKMSELKRGIYTGSSHPRAKLCEDDVLEIKRQIAEGVKGRVIAQQFGVDKRTISNIKRGISWKHVN